MRHYQQIFYAAYGFGPYECFFCREKTVPFDGGRKAPDMHIHHIDCNKENNHPLNLAPAHNRCHRRWHVLVDGIPNREGNREFGRIGPAARWAKAGAKERQAELTRERNWGNTYNKGKKSSPEARERQAAARAAWWARLSPEERAAHVEKMREGLRR